MEVYVSAKVVEDLIGVTGASTTSVETSTTSMEASVEFVGASTYELVPGKGINVHLREVKNEKR